MENKFKVMPWLRELRDRNTAECKGLTPDEMVRKTEAAAAEFHGEYMRQHPDAVVHKAGENPALQKAV